MKTFFFAFLITLCCSAWSWAQSPLKLNKALEKTDNWTQKDLIEPSALAAIIANPKAKQAKIFNIGVVDDIKGAKNMGGASEKENLEKFKDTLSKLPKNTFLVVYCGCCPFEKCPNIRPAIGLIKSMGFINVKLLNLPTNLKQNWIDSGYPLATK